jgi:hypothetical protein
MADTPKAPSRKGLGAAFFVLLILAVGIAAVQLLPMFDCPACEGTGRLDVALRNSKRTIPGAASDPCPACRAGKVTLYRKLDLPPIDSLLPAQPAK